MSSPIGGANYDRKRSQVANVVDATDAFGPIKLDDEQGTEFGWGDRLYMAFQDGMVFDYGDWEARDLAQMMSKDYKARQIDNVLSLPILSATYAITGAKGDSGEADWLNGFWADDDSLNNSGCETPLRQIIDLCTSSFTYKRAFFEKVWGIDPDDGKTIFSKLAWRPQTTCRLARDPENGNFAGFQQQAYFIGPNMNNANKWPINVKARNSFVHIYGQRRDPLGGLSDLEIPYWAWKTKQKILFLWFQFLEGVSLPTKLVYAVESDDANRIAAQVAKAKSSAVVPVYSPGGVDQVKVENLDSSGKGAAQFMEAISWLDQCATHSVLAGFLDLTGTAVRAFSNGGSYALSKDASDFFLQSEEAKAAELASSIRRNLFAPLIRYNFGPKANVPLFAFEPLNDEDKSYAVTMLTDLMRSRDPALVPDEFIGELAKQVATYIGMDGDKIMAAFQKASEDAKKAAAAATAAGATQTGQQIAGVNGAVNAARGMVNKAQASGAAKAPKPPSVTGINTPQLPATY